MKFLAFARVGFAVLGASIVFSIGDAYGQSPAEGEPHPQKCLDTDPWPTPELKWPTVQTKTRTTQQCWLNLKEALAAEQAPGGVIWVDVRPGAKAKTQPLNGTLQLQPQELAEKPFLRQGKVILIGSGFDHAVLEQTCQQLRKQGLNHVQALEGGVRSWVRAGRFMGGTQPLTDDIAPEDFLQAINVASLKVVAVGLSAEEVARLPEKPVRVWPENFGPEKMQNQLKSLATKGLEPGSADSPSIVIVARSDQSIQPLKQALVGSQQTNQVLWLQGGWEAYQRYVVQQHQIISNAGRPLVRPCGAV